MDKLKATRNRQPTRIRLHDGQNQNTPKFENKGRMAKKCSGSWKF